VVFSRALVLCALPLAVAACGGPASLSPETSERSLSVPTSTDASCPGGPSISFQSAARDNPASPLTGLYVTVQQAGIAIATGWTPLTVADLCADQDYVITAADYRSYRFAAWEDGTHSAARTITLRGSIAVTAFYQVGGSIIPLYSWPTDASGDVTPAWRAVARAHQDFPAVAVIPIVNNQNGPGPARDPSWTRGIDLLVAGGCKVAAYVYTEYGQRPLAAVEDDIARWRAWYPSVTALFLDQMSNTAGQEAWYSAVSAYARAQGFDFVIGNPGASTLPSYVGTVDTLIIHESTQVPSSFASWQAGYSANNFATLSYGIPGPLPEPQLTSNKDAVAYQYVTDDGAIPDANPWDRLSGHLEVLLSLLEP